MEQHKLIQLRFTERPPLRQWPLALWNMDVFVGEVPMLKLTVALSWLARCL